MNFSFWSELDNDNRFAVLYKASLKDPNAPLVHHTGYASLLAAIARARDEGLDITNPNVYAKASADTIKHVFRSSRAELIPLLQERIDILHDSGQILLDKFDGSIVNLIKQANGSAQVLVNLLVDHFPSLRDQVRYKNRTIYIWKRAQICVAEMWAALEGKRLGAFHDIDSITMFADYRVPQILESLGIIRYSPDLRQKLENHILLPYGSDEEVSIRALSIVAVEELRIKAKDLIEDSCLKIEYPNAITLDFALWNLAKEQEKTSSLPHHRTRSIYY